MQVKRGVTRARQGAAAAEAAAAATPEDRAAARAQLEALDHAREASVVAWRDALARKLGANPPWNRPQPDRNPTGVRAFARALQLAGADAAAPATAPVLVPQPLTPLTRSVLSALRVPTELLDFLTQFSFADDVRCGDTTLTQVNRLAFVNCDEAYVEHGLVAIGAVAGETLVIDLSTLSVGLLGQAWIENRRDPRAQLVDLQLDIGQLFLQAARVQRPSPAGRILKIAAVVLLLAFVVSGLVRACGGH